MSENRSSGKSTIKIYKNLTNVCPNILKLINMAIKLSIIVD